jgi:hypothetical protein
MTEADFVQVLDLIINYCSPPEPIVSMAPGKPSYNKVMAIYADKLKRYEPFLVGKYGRGTRRKNNQVFG